ncbi:MAG: phosphoribosylformylglycinamidine synthase, partial [Clostridia bacterium]|nr:phosphoribosylformylglycinamidine synthase [Clostridia bacterium]
MIYRLYVEKKAGLAVQAEKLKADLKEVLSISADSARVFIRYDVEGMTAEDFEKAVGTVFSEPPVDNVYREELPDVGDLSVFAVEYLPGQYDQRADSAAQCVQLLTKKQRPLIRCATVYAIGVSGAELDAVKHFLINPVESREASLVKPETLALAVGAPKDVPVIEGFIAYTDGEIAAYHKEIGFAMSVADLCFVRDHFKKEGRDPYETELKVLDTYWSDHCRHTT